MRNSIYFVCSLVLMAIGVGMVRGDVQKVIYFEDAINEILFTMLMFTLSVLVLFNFNQKSK